MRQNRGYKLLIVIGIFLATISIVCAANPGGAGILSSAIRGNWSGFGPQSISVISGNITSANLDTNASTYRWTGLLGNVTGKIILGDSTNAQLYNWSALGRLVFASTSATVSWGGLADATSADAPGYLNTIAADNYTSTFSVATNNIGSNIFSSITSDYAITVGNQNFKTYSLKSGAALVWAGNVSENTAAYSGEPEDYQMMIPEDGTSGDTTAATYYLWVELV